MTKLKLVVALGAVAAILAVPAWGAGAKGTDTSAATTPQITVNGTGTVKSVPDIAVWNFSVSSRATSAREALKLNGVEMRKVIAALKPAETGAYRNYDGEAIPW